MDQERDIYSKQPPPPVEKVEYRDVDVPPQLLRSESRRRFLLSALFIIMFLGVSILLFLYIDDRTHRADLEDLTEEELAALTRPRPTERRQEFTLPEMPPEFDSLFEDPPPGMDPARVTRAMGYVRIARRHAGVEEWDQALINAQRALTIWPDMTAAYGLLGFIYTQRGQFDQALAVLSRALVQDPFNPETYNTIAAIYMQQGQMQQAEEMLHTAIDLSPEYVHAFINLGMLYLLLGEFERAADNFEIVLERIPGHTAIRNNLAVCFIRMGRFREAQSHLQHLIDLQPEEASLYFNMAISFTEQGDMDTAMKWIRQAAQLCTPMEFQHFMADPDFAELRQHAEYRKFVDSHFPQIPQPFTL